MDNKYLRDGRKVVVLSTLNREEFIVQEVFVAENGDEFPAGENFTARGLLDEPAETYACRQEKGRAETLARLKREIDLAAKKLKEAERRLRRTNLYDGVLEIYQDKTPEDIKALLAFMSGEITHVVAGGYHAPEIVELLDALEYKDDGSDGWNTRFAGLKLVTLFGVQCGDRKRYDDDKRLGLEWRIDRYPSPSGGESKIYPCRGLEEAVAVADKILAERDVSQEGIDLKAKHGLANPTDERIQEWRAKNRKQTEERINKLGADIDKLRASIDDEPQ